MSGAVAHAARVSAAGLAFGVMLSCGGGGPDGSPDFEIINGALTQDEGQSLARPR